MWFIDRINSRNDDFYVVNTETGEEQVLCLTKLMQLPDLEGVSYPNRPSKLCVSDLYIDPKYRLLWGVNLRRRGDKVSYLYFDFDYLERYNEVRLSNFGDSFASYSIDCGLTDAITIIVDDKIKHLDRDTFSNLVNSTSSYIIDITSCTSEEVAIAMYDFAMYRNELSKIRDNFDRYKLLIPYSYVKNPHFEYQMIFPLTERYDKLLVQELGEAMLTVLAKGQIYLEYNGCSLTSHEKVALQNFLKRDDSYRPHTQMKLTAIHDILREVCDDYITVNKLIAYYDRGGQDPSIISSFRSLCEAICSC